MVTTSLLKLVVEVNRKLASLEQIKYTKHS